MEIHIKTTHTLPRAQKIPARKKSPRTKKPPPTGRPFSKESIAPLSQNYSFTRKPTGIVVVVLTVLFLPVAFRRNPSTWN